jgi:hypothetical protein
LLFQGRKSVSYHVFEAPPQNRATVHKSECPHCRSGLGQEKRKGKKVTDWYGPYQTREEAFARADRTGMGRVVGCGHCKP